MTQAEQRRMGRATGAGGDCRAATNLRVRSALRESRPEQTPQPPAKDPAAGAAAIGLELVQLSNSIQRDLSRAQTLVGELRGIAYALEQKR